MRNGFTLKEALHVALEVTWPDLPADQAGTLRRLVEQVPGCIGSVDLDMAPADKAAVEACMAHFRQSHTWYWLREDFAGALNELEYLLAKC